MGFHKIVSTIVCFISLTACVYMVCILSLVPRNHIIFTFCSITYSAFANAYIRHTSPETISSSRLRKSIAPRSASARLLFPFTLIFSLIAPGAALIIAEQYDIKPPLSRLHAMIIPHLFLVLMQIFCETFASAVAPYFSLYVRLGFAIAFISYRLRALFSWYSFATAWSNSREASRLPSFLVAFTQATAVLNVVFWTLGLLCFLLLYCLPSLIIDPEQNSETTDEKES